MCIRDRNVPSDKSISIRALILASYCIGKCKIFNLLESDDVLNTLEVIKNNYILSALLGFVGGPLSYSAGVGIGSLEIHTLTSYILLALAWAVVVPSLFKYANTYD